MRETFYRVIFLFLVYRKNWLRRRHQRQRRDMCARWRLQQPVQLFHWRANQGESVLSIV